MDPKFLRHLAVVVNHGSLTRAAARLGVTQPTLTRSIKIIEDRVGAQVLMRSRHGVIPTEIGLRLAEIGNRIADEAILADDAIRQWRHGVRDEVRVGVGPLLQFAAMKDFIARAPRDADRVAHFKVGPASLLLPELHRGVIDLLLAPSNLELEHSQLDCFPVFDDAVRVMVGRKSRFHDCGRKVRLAELRDERWILSGASAGLFGPGTHAETDGTPEMIFTGAIDFVAHLLSTSDVVVRMPIRLMMLSGTIEAGQVLDTGETPEPRKIAIWTSAKAMERTAVRGIHERLLGYFRDLDQQAPRCGVV